MKDLELRLISELVKDCRRSDRQLAKALGVSQPTVTRTINKLEKEGYIREYTIIPDFSKLGYELMGFTFVKQRENLNGEEGKEVREKTKQLEKENPHASLMVVNGIGLNKDLAIVTLYENYSAYVRAMEIVKKIPYADLEQIDSFLVNLRDPEQYRLLTTSALAKHMLTLGKQKA